MTRKVTKNSRLKPKALGFKPRFEHDCDKCKFIGQLENFDIYTCGNRSIIARCSSEDSDYGSYNIGCMTQEYWVTLVCYSNKHVWNTFILVLIRELQKAGALSISISLGGAK